MVFILTVCDTNMAPLHIIEDYSSILWCERFNEAGDFELVLPLTNENLSIYKLSRYIRKSDTDRIMSIEDIEISMDYTDTHNLTISGKSLEYMLSKRIVWERTRTAYLGESLASYLTTLVTEAFINTGDETARKIDNFRLETIDSTYIKHLTLELDYYFDNLYEVISNICRGAYIGYKIVWDGVKKAFVMSFFTSVQKNVIFSMDLDNIINMKLLNSTGQTKNLAMVKGYSNAYGCLHEYSYLGEQEPSGLFRNEVCIDGSGIYIDPNWGEEEIMLYLDVLRDRGITELSTQQVVNLTSFEISSSSSYEYKVDFDVGNVVNIIDLYGNTNYMRLTEMVLSLDTEGFKMTPTFESFDRMVI